MSDIQTIIDTLSSLTIRQAAELAKALEETWGVSAAMPVAAAAVTSANEPAEAKTEFDVILQSFDAAKKINVIKEVKAITGLGLSESKALVEGAPKPIKEGISKKDADELKQKLEAAGAEILVK